MPAAASSLSDYTPGTSFFSVIPGGNANLKLDPSGLVQMLEPAQDVVDTVMAALADVVALVEECRHLTRPLDREAAMVEWMVAKAQYVADQIR